MFHLFLRSLWRNRFVHIRHRRLTHQSPASIRWTNGDRWRSMSMYEHAAFYMLQIGQSSLQSCATPSDYIDPQASRNLLSLWPESQQANHNDVNGNGNGNSPLWRRCGAARRAVDDCDDNGRLFVDRRQLLIDEDSTHKHSDPGPRTSFQPLTYQLNSMLPVSWWPRWKPKLGSVNSACVTRTLRDPRTARRSHWVQRKTSFPLIHEPLRSTSN